MCECLINPSERKCLGFDYRERVVWKKGRYRLERGGESLCGRGRVRNREKKLSVVLRWPMMEMDSA